MIVSQVIHKGKIKQKKHTKTLNKMKSTKPELKMQINSKNMNLK